MHRLSALMLTVVLFGGALRGQSLNAFDLFQAFGKAVAEDNFATMKELLAQNKETIRYAWMDGEAQYFSSVANSSQKDMETRSNVLQKFAQLVGMEQKDGWYNDRFRWATGLNREAAAKMVKVYEVYEAADRDFAEARKTGGGDFFAKAVKGFEALERSAAAADDGFYRFMAYWYLGASHKQQLNHFEAIYSFKQAIDVGRSAKLESLLAREDLPAQIKKIADIGRVDAARIDIRLPLVEAKAKYDAPDAPPEPSPDQPKAPEGGKPEPGPAKPGGAAKARANAPPLPNKHGGKTDWVEAEKPKIKEVGDRNFLSSNHASNAAPLRWQSVNIKPGADSKFPFVHGDHMLLNDKGKILFDPDGSGGKAAAEKLKLGTKPESVKFAKRNFGSAADDAVGDVIVRLMEQPTTYKIMGFEAKENPDREGITLLYACGMSMSSKFDGYEVTVYDDNADGRFDSKVEDSVVVAKGAVKKVAPLSKIAYVGDLLYELEADPAGRSMKFRPYDGPVALLSADFGTGPAPAFVTIRGVGPLDGVAFNLVDAKDRWMWVPAGDYEIAHGYLSYGDGDRRETIQIFPGRAKPMTLKPNEETVWKLGGAEGGYRFLWSARKEGDVVHLKGKDIKVFGAAGEEYLWFMPGVFRPTVSARLGEKGEPFFKKEMAKIDEGAVRSDGGLRWYPKDMEIKISGKGDVYIQLEENYPKLGKISSAPVTAQ